jgi:hypothetical protein
MDLGRPPRLGGAVVLPKRRRLTLIALTAPVLQPAAAAIGGYVKAFSKIISRISACCNAAKFGAIWNTYRIYGEQHLYCVAHLLNRSRFRGRRRDSGTFHALRRRTSPGRRRLRCHSRYSCESASYSTVDLKTGLPSAAPHKILQPQS